MRPIALPPGVTVFERGWLSANNILFAGPGGTALVDSGYCTHSRQTLSLVEASLGARPLDLLLNTHLHSDHCGGNAALQQRYPALKTLIPPGLAAQVVDWDPVALTYVPTGQACPRFSISGVLQPGSQITLGSQVWQVHAAPGHDPHSIMLFEPESRTLISADALWQNGFGVVFPELEEQDAFGEVAATLELIEQLEPDLVIPGHGGLFTDVAGALVAARRRLDSFVRDPQRHANHAAKVLLKFKLLELHQVSIPAFKEWASTTPYFGMVHSRWFNASSMAEWIDEVTDELVKAGAARREGDSLLNS